jgi:hypothetical protein
VGLCFCRRVYRAMKPIAPVVFPERQKRLTADAIALLVLAVESAFVIAAGKAVLPGRFTTGLAIGAFPVLAGISIAIFHAEDEKLSAAKWAWLALGSPVVGFGFFGVDWFLAFAFGGSDPLHYPTTPLGLPLTILVCPVSTMVCVAGFARALWVRRIPNA